MIIVYSPDGGEPEHYDARSLKVSEVGIVQRTIDQKWADIKQGLAEEDLDAMRGVVWVLKKRTQPALRFAEFDPGVEEMVTRIDRREVETWAEATAELAWQAPEATSETVMAALRIVPATALDREHAEAFVEQLAAGPKEAPAPQ